MKNLADIKKILIIGAGTLGLRIGLRCALDGYEVVMYDIGQKQLDTAIMFQEKILKSLIKKGDISLAQADIAVARISTTSDKNEAVKGIDLVSESVIENVELKKKMYAEFAPLFEPQTIITTNTSYLLSSMFAAETGRPHLFCALHFHDVFTANVVDIMPHPGTPIWLSELLMEFGKTIHQTPVFVKKENSGYIFNAMLMAVIGSAGDLLTRDVSSIKDIDRSWMGNMNVTVGPFGMLDQVGLDTAWHIVSVRTDSKSQRFAVLLKELVDAGKLGVKSGEGFYTYPNPEYRNADFIQ
jgi:3-hydroxybutyryl-CoA dehydrogenase